jgi:hypothetical protein
MYVCMFVHACLVCIHVFVYGRVLDFNKTEFVQVRTMLPVTLGGFGDDFGFGFWAGKPDRGSPPCTKKKSTAEKKIPPSMRISVAKSGQSV